jgi:hypothetical protein
MPNEAWVLVLLIIGWLLIPARYDPAFIFKRWVEEAFQTECERHGHTLAFVGGRNACCGNRDCCCSVPVYRCEVCDDYDYGDNQEATEIMRECAERRAEEDVDV